MSCFTLFTHLLSFTNFFDVCLPTCIALDPITHLHILIRFSFMHYYHFYLTFYLRWSH